jgi:hypothetical protein
MIGRGSLKWRFRAGLRGLAATDSPDQYTQRTVPGKINVPKIGGGDEKVDRSDLKIGGSDPKTGGAVQRSTGRSKDRGERCKDRRERCKDRRGRSKDRAGRSKDRRGRSKDRAGRSKDRRERSKSRRERSKSRRERSKDRRERSKDRRGGPKIGKAELLMTRANSGSGRSDFELAGLISGSTFPFTGTVKGMPGATLPRQRSAGAIPESAPKAIGSDLYLIFDIHIGRFNRGSQLAVVLSSVRRKGQKDGVKKIRALSFCPHFLASPASRSCDPADPSAAVPSLRCNVVCPAHPAFQTGRDERRGFDFRAQHLAMSKQ